MSGTRDPAENPVVEVEDLSVHFEVSGAGLFRRRRQQVRAVDGVSFTVHPGETLGLVGESGSGKSTTGRAILRRVDATGGRIIFRGQDITHVGGERLRRLRRHMQLVYQDPYASLNPRMRVREIVAEPLLVHHICGREEAWERVQELLALTGLPEDAAERLPNAFSGGQRQRIGIARALALQPELIVADEPVSALDVSIQAQVVNLLEDLQDKFGIAYLFIAHDLSVVRHISHRIGIMYAGQIVELAQRSAVFEQPFHPYTAALLSAVPVPDPEAQESRERIVLKGDMPSPMKPPAGCRFHTRCPYRQAERCDTEEPLLRPIAPGHLAACHYAEEINHDPVAMLRSNPTHSSVAVSSRDRRGSESEITQVV